MTQNVMFMAFRHAASLVESIELLEAFKLMACRQPIVDCVEQMTSQVMSVNCKSTETSFSWESLY